MQLNTQICHFYDKLLVRSFIKEADNYIEFMFELSYVEHITYKCTIIMQQKEKEKKEKRENAIKTPTGVRFLNFLDILKW